MRVPLYTYFDPLPRQAYLIKVNYQGQEWQVARRFKMFEKLQAMVGSPEQHMATLFALRELTVILPTAAIVCDGATEVARFTEDTYPLARPQP